MAIETFANAPTPSSPATAWTTITGALTAGFATIPLLAGSAFPSSGQFRVLIDNNIIVVTRSGNTLTVVSHEFGEATHASGASVYHILTAAGLARHPRAMTTLADIEYLDSNGAPARLGIGSVGQVLTVTAGLPAWATPVVGGSPGQLLYNNAGALGGFGSWDAAGNVLNVGAVPAFAFTTLQDAGSLLIGENTAHYSGVFTFASGTSGGNYGVQSVMYMGTVDSPTPSIDGQYVAAFGMQAWNGISPQALVIWYVSQIGDWPNANGQLELTVLDQTSTNYGFFVDAQSKSVYPAHSGMALGTSAKPWGSIQSDNYKSSDGSAGVTAGPFTVITSITVKDGLVVAIAGS